MKRFERLLFNSILIGACLICLWSNLALADDPPWCGTATVTLTLDGTPNDATANSVWNLKAVYTNNYSVNGVPVDIWPGQYLLGASGGSDGYVDMNTTGGLRPVDGEWYPEALQPNDAGFLDGFDGFDASSPSYISLQPDPDATIPNESYTNSKDPLDLKYDHGLDALGVPATALPGDPTTISSTWPKTADLPPLDTVGILVPPSTGSHKVSATLVLLFNPNQSPQWLMGVWGETGPIKAIITSAKTVSSDWPDVYVIAITDTYPTTISFAAYVLGTHYVFTQPAQADGLIKGKTQCAMPLPYTVYKYTTSTANQTKLNVNPAIFALNPNKTLPNDADPLSLGAKPGPNSPLLGVYANDDLSGPNYFTWGAQNYTVQPSMDTSTTYGQISLTGLPAKVPKGSTFYVKVSTYAVDGVYIADPGSGAGTVADNLCPVSGQQQWMIGTLDASRTIVTPANAAAISNVDGVYDFWMDGTLDVTRTVVTLASPELVGSIMGVYTAQDLTGTNLYNGTKHPYTSGSATVLLPSPAPGTSTSVSIAYRPGINDTWMTGTLDSSRMIVTLSSPTGIGSLVGVFATKDNTTTNYYSAKLNPYQSGSATVTLSTPVPGFGTTVQVDYRPANVLGNYFSGGYTAGDPTITLATPVPGSATTVQIAYESATGGMYSSKQGLIKLATPVSKRGQKVYVRYRPLSQTKFTPGAARPTFVNEIIPMPDGLPTNATPVYKWDPKGYDPDVLKFTGKLVLTGTDILPAGTWGAEVDYWSDYPDDAFQSHLDVNVGGIMYYVSGTPTTGGATYRCAISGGLNMSSLLQQPTLYTFATDVPTINNKLIYDPRSHPMWYAPGLRAGDPKARTIKATAMIGCGSNPSGSVGVTVHDSRALGVTSSGLPEMIDYGGKGGDCDWLSCYPDTFGGSWPETSEIYPLTVEPTDLANQSTPNDGSGSTEFVFRCRYHNSDGTSTMPPRPWLDFWADGQSDTPPTGVVVYLEKSPGDYRPHFMYLEKPTAQPSDPLYDVWMYRVIPHNIQGWAGSGPAFFPMPTGYEGTYFDNEQYESLACGTYHYFFACSDDYIAFDGGSRPTENQDPTTITDPQAVFTGVEQWAQDPYEAGLGGSTNTSGYGGEWWTLLPGDSAPSPVSSGLDPTVKRQVAGYSAINRSPGRRYAAVDQWNYEDPFDYTILVDRPVRVPGHEEGNSTTTYKYPWSCDVHPVVTCELRMPEADDVSGLRYDDPIYGAGRFFGTIFNYYRAVNPTMIGALEFGDVAALAETTGATTQTANVFRIMYKQMTNLPPISIKVYINNASEKTPATAAAADVAAHQYTGYTMYERSDQSFPDPNTKYTNGVWYEYKTNLPPGPHTYYFEAYDGQHIVRFPVRPDQFNYNTVNLSDASRAAASTFTIEDWYVPTHSLETDRGTATYIDNDYIPGPYVNNPPVLSNSSVTPGTGKAGQTYRFRVKVADADGQKMFKTSIWIQTKDNQPAQEFAMMLETPEVLPVLPDSTVITDATAYAAAVKKYFADWAAIIAQRQAGEYYYLEAGSPEGIALANGVRRYRFEFVDDWGRLSDINDKIQGETTTLPAGAGNWFDGPVISGNVAPTLYNGSVTSADGTSNAATLWTYKVTYRDVNNDPPALVKLYLGLLQHDGRTILWDSGHAMSASNPSDTVYSDGADYFYQTRLGAVSTVDPSASALPDPKQYYYAFEAYDGSAWATYKASSNPDQKSDAAGAVIFDNAIALPAGTISTDVAYQDYKLRPLVVQQGTISGSNVVPGNPGDILNVVGMYLTEDLTGTNFYSAASDTRLFSAGNATITLSTPLPAGTTQVYIVYAKKDTSVVIPMVANGSGSGSVLNSIPSDIQTVLGVYASIDPATGKLLGTNYYEPYDSIPINQNASQITSSTTKLWISYEGQAPIVGPIPIALPAPAGVIPDAEVYKNYATSASELMIDDVKNGFVSSTARGTLMMHGMASYFGEPSASYCTPDSPANIASVEGVYLTPYMDGPYPSGSNYSADYKLNYFDPAAIIPPALDPARSVAASDVTGPMNWAVVKTGTAGFDGYRSRVTPSDPDSIVKVYGIYDNANLSGTNYYLGDGWLNPDLSTRYVPYLTSGTPTPDPARNTRAQWQVANIVSVGTVWPTKPNDIATIWGVYESQSTADIAGSFYAVDPDYGVQSAIAVQTDDPGARTLATDGSGTITAVTPIDGRPIKTVTGVYIAVDGSGHGTGTNYYNYTSKVTSGYSGSDRWTSTAIYVNSIPAGTASIYIQYVPYGFGAFGQYYPMNELLSLNAAWPDPAYGGAGVALTQAYVAYFPPYTYVPAGQSMTVNSNGYPTTQVSDGTITCTSRFPNGHTAYILAQVRSFNAGDSVIKLTQNLQPLWQGGTLAGNLFTPDNASAIGSVTGVYTNQLMTGFNYMDTLNPFKAGDSVIHVVSSTPKTTPLYVAYQPPSRPLYIKYSDTRFTHQLHGTAEQVIQALDYGFQSTGYGYYDNYLNVYDEYGNTHFYPDGVNANATSSLGAFYIKSNADGSTTDSWDTLTGGPIGVWLGADETGTNYFNPRTVSVMDPEWNMGLSYPYLLRLSQPVPSTTVDLWTQFYQRGVYQIDRWSRNLHFLTAQRSTDNIQVSYFFGTKMPMTLGSDSPPGLSAGRVTPLNGPRAVKYIYTVTYQDSDGPNGQAPAYVRVFIDGVPYDMTATNSGSTPAYGNGAAYTYTPTSPTGGAHRYHFEASDGLMISWFDANGAHQSLAGSTPSAVADINGPWINDPPALSTPLAAPNPTSGTIDSGTSVDYTVVYTDADNDPPYVVDLVGDVYPIDWSNPSVTTPCTNRDVLSGSPRVWIDSGAGDSSWMGTILSLSADPLDKTKIRIINATNIIAPTGAAATALPTNGLAGSLLQITSDGTALNRVYLVQSNTATSLTIATDDLGPTGDDLPAGSTFRINGLLMSKADATQQDFTAGVTYKITVPKLAIGNHTFHFTARSRESKPVWLQQLLTTAQEAQWPYSIAARALASGEIPGPNVSSTSPSGNKSPTLYATSATVLNKGPEMWSTTVYSVSGTTATLNNTGSGGPTDGIQQVLGIYVHADMDQDAVDNTNYYDSVNSPYTANVNITFPIGTSGVAKDTPVYVKYYATTPTSAVYKSTDTLTYRAQYSDPDGDPPTYHDNVQGYLNLVFTDSGRTVPMLPEMPSPQAADYKNGVWFNVSLTDSPQGKHAFHFEASDGWHVVRYPILGTGNTTTNDYSEHVNYQPAVLSGSVDRVSGDTTFNFSAVYRDLDGVKPALGGFVKVHLTQFAGTKVSGQWQDIKVTMTSGATSGYATGVTYTCAVLASALVSSASYHTEFIANDGYEDAAALAGPDIKVRDPNTDNAPQIVSYSVNPANGKTAASFTYTANYLDIDNDPPVLPTSSSPGLTLIVDKGAATEQRFTMSSSATGSVDYTASGGVAFTTKSISGKQLGAGHHTYTVTASDGQLSSVFATGVPSSQDGPVLMTPYFNLTVKTKDGLAVSNESVVGQEVLIQGTMLFPYVNTSTPSELSNVTVQVTKPDGTPIALSASVAQFLPDDSSNPKNWVGDITVKYNGYADPAMVTQDSLTLTSSGLWKIGAIWPGNSYWDSAQTGSNTSGQNASIQVTVSGPSRTVAVSDPQHPDTSAPIWDMITPPMLISSPDPGSIFGHNPALQMQIIRWSPASQNYFLYSGNGVFPSLQPGDAMWIKPKQYDSTTLTGYPAAVPLGYEAGMSAYLVINSTTIQLMPQPDQSGNSNCNYVADVKGVYVGTSATGTNYYTVASATTAGIYVHGNSQVTLTKALPAGTTAGQVYVDYISYPFTAVDDGWISLDDPTDAKMVDTTGEMRYLHTDYRLITAQVQAYSMQTDSSGSVVTDPATGLGLSKPCLISLKTGWNQFGNMFFNWQKATQNGVATTDLTKVTPSQGSVIGSVLGVYTSADMSSTATNYYKPGTSTHAYQRGDAQIYLTSTLPVGTTQVYIKYEVYPRKDLGIPISDCHVVYLGSEKTLSEAAVAGWVLGYAWRYDANGHQYVQVGPAAAETNLTAWSGYWIKAFVDCQLKIDPNTTSASSASASSLSVKPTSHASSLQKLDMPPAAPGD